jgi:AraC-like DNA-binding protein/tetratricopeptide (TPR) repeat protein
MMRKSRFDRGAPSHSGPASKDVWRAIEYLRASMARKITTAELAAASGVAERTLRKHFRRFVGHAPLQHWRRLRLAAARDALMSGAEDVSITDIATRYGFGHFGRFSLQYRRCFGETPSDTLSRSRAAAWAQLHAGRSVRAVRPEREKPSIALLPLQTSAIELELRDFTGAVPEGIAAALSGARSVSVVVPRHSRNAVEDRILERESRARYALRGRIIAAKAHIRVIMRLQDEGTGEVLWGDSFDGEASDLLGLQDRITEGVLRAILPGIRGAEIERTQRQRPEDLDAYGLTMRAFPFALAANPDAACRALDLLNRAMEFDPDYALPVALAAWCHAQLFMHNGTEQPAKEKERALLLAIRAGVLDSDDPLVLTARSAVHTMARQLDMADALIARVLALDPSSAWAWERSGWLKTFAGEPESAIAHFRRAICLDPDGPSNANRFVGLGSAHFDAARYDEAALWMRDALLRQPATAWVNRTLAVSYARLGQRLAALESLNAFRRYCPDATIAKVVASVPFTADFLERVADGLNDLGLPP